MIQKIQKQVTPKFGVRVICHCFLNIDLSMFLSCRLDKSRVLQICYLIVNHTENFETRRKSEFSIDHFFSFGSFG